MAMLAGMGSGGAAGGVIGALAGLSIPEYEAKNYGNHIKKGGILISIRANSEDRAKRIEDVLQENGAEDISISSEATIAKPYKK